MAADAMHDSTDPAVLAARLDGVCQRIDDLRENVRTYAPTAVQVGVIQSELQSVREDIHSLREDVGRLEEGRNSSVKLLATAIGTAVVAYIGAKLTGQAPG